MMAAAQPFLSGAISKTVNMPEESTVEDIMEAYIESWKYGLKAVAIYRDNSKRSQPLSAAGKKDKVEEKAAVEPTPSMVEPPSPEQQDLFPGTRRRKLPSERDSVTHKFSIGGHEKGDDRVEGAPGKQLPKPKGTPRHSGRGLPLIEIGYD